MPGFLAALLPLLNIIGTVGGAVMTADYLTHMGGGGSPTPLPEGGTPEEMDLQEMLGGWKDMPQDPISRYDADVMGAQSRGSRIGSSMTQPGRLANTTDRSLDALLAGHEGRLAAMQVPVPPTITQLYAQRGLLDGFMNKQQGAA